MDAPMPRYPDLAGKVAVVTGSSQGIGAVTCRLLAAYSAKVVVNGRDPAALGETVTRIRKDRGEPGALERLREETERSYGPADLLGAFVGGGGLPPGPHRPDHPPKPGRRPSGATSP